MSAGANRSRYWTRKEIAAANEVAVETIRRREHKLGLDKHRDGACRKPIRYIREGADQCLKAVGMNTP